MKTGKDIAHMIAVAIKEADNSYFFEDYTKQANSVVATLARKGLVIVPVDPTEDMINFTKDNLPYGRQKPEDMLKNIYKTMIAAAKGNFKAKPPSDDDIQRPIF